MNCVDTSWIERGERLRALDLFASLSDAHLERLARAVVHIAFEAGAAIVCEGDAGEYFYVVVQGEVEIARGGRLVAVRGPGEYFGEIALLRGIPRTATVVARSAVTLYAVDRRSFLAGVSANRRSRRIADAVVTERLA